MYSNITFSDVSPFSGCVDSLGFVLVNLLDIVFRPGMSGLSGSNVSRTRLTSESSSVLKLQNIRSSFTLQPLLTPLTVCVTQFLAYPSPSTPPSLVSDEKFIYKTTFFSV